MSWGKSTSTVLVWGEDLEESEVVFVVIDTTSMCVPWCVPD